MVIKFQRFLVYAAAGALVTFHQLFCDAKVMMEYIGATGVSVSFEEVPIQDGVDFHFILGFAVDADPSGASQDGTFSPYWADTLTPDAVSSIKSEHPNVKALASLSGWSIGNNEVLRWYKPKDPNRWISNAFSSLKTLVEKYHLDGIDVDYESFKKHDHQSFALCIGELITQLKNQRVISIATIAPFYSTAVAYAELFRNYSQQIDYVNYQFYTDKIENPDGYLKAFRVRAEQFDQTKLLPSYEVNGRGLQGDSFFDALKLLEDNRFDVNGVMIFSADASSENGFYSETKSHAFLLNSTALL